MPTQAYMHGQLATLQQLGLRKEAADLVEQLAAAEAGTPLPPAGAPTKGVPGFFSKLRNTKIPLKAGLGAGALVGGGMLLHELNKTPQMDVIPSAPLGHLYP